MNFLFRMEWLQQGSRELFGTIIEDQVCYLSVTNASQNKVPRLLSI